jgi:gluconate 5-dehydrogenase
LPGQTKIALCPFPDSDHSTAEFVCPRSTIIGLVHCTSHQHSADGDHVLGLLSMVKHFDLSKRIALVTGASRGLGYAMAGALAEAGATVILNGRDAGTLKVAADRIRDRGFRAETMAFDVNDQPAADAAIKSIVDHHQRLDILIANAGVTHRAQLADWTPEAWDKILSANLKACFFLAQQAAAPMRRQRYGRIIFITSAVGILGRSTVHAYAAAKSGLAGLARSLAAELGEDGITCNAIAPGWFETELTAPLLKDEAFVARINSRVPLRRWGKPHDLVGAAIFLASDAAGYITAQQIVVDGGLSTTM